ncbi:MAG: hypothetical protein HYS15_03190 [Candidatus Spechtbacteria bacterium]|nr:hypothetical protein [Candidatus Spechtbacteria bacterium]
MAKQRKFLKFLFFAPVFFGFLIITACASDAKSPPQVETAVPTPTFVTPTPTKAQSLRMWDGEFQESACKADGNAPLLDQALANANLKRSNFGFLSSDWEESPYSTHGYLSDEFLLPWFVRVRAEPARAGCFEGFAAGALDFYMKGKHPAASIIRHSSRLLDYVLDEEKPIDSNNLPGDFDQALKALCEYASGCQEESGEIPSELKKSLTPLLWTIIEGLKARAEMDKEAWSHDANWWNRYGGNFILADFGNNAPDPLLSDRGYFASIARGNLYRAASQIAFAIEDIDWSPFVGQKGVRYDLSTGAGWFHIYDGSSDTHQDKKENILLLIDLGGDDVYLNDVASNTSGVNAVSIVIDLAGNDKYGYETNSALSGEKGLLAPDDGGRANGNGISLSNHSRQGGARNGIAMLFDFGGGNDTYQSLRASQGYAHFGVGVLFDDGGDDVYVSETASQGSAQFGIGILIDRGRGNDSYRSFSFAQGFGYVAGVGILFDEGGNDSYSCDHGDPAKGGIPLYYTPQLPDKGNSSFCQGAGFGRRGNDKNKRTFLSGGLGILRDKEGDDTYEASVFAQGTGYWQGTGILSDGGGNDRYDAYWYVQGAAAHFAVGILADAGDGDDVFNGTRPSCCMNLGAGHDFSLGVLINEKGNDMYYITSLSAGASNCNGIGLFVDNNGNDTYRASSDYGSGMGNVSGECIKNRPNARSIGIMIDGGGIDIYQYPESEFPMPGENKTWGHSRNGLESEHGAGLDGEGETGVHPESG